MKRRESLLTLLIHIDAVCQENLRGLVVSPNDDAVERIIAKLVRRVDVREVNVAEIRRLLNALQNG